MPKKMMDAAMVWIPNVEKIWQKKTLMLMLEISKKYHKQVVFNIFQPFSQVPIGWQKSQKNVARNHWKMFPWFHLNLPAFHEKVMSKPILHKRPHEILLIDNEWKIKYDCLEYCVYIKMSIYIYKYMIVYAYVIINAYMYICICVHVIIYI